MSQSLQTLAPLDVPPATLVSLSAAANLAPLSTNLVDTSSAAVTVTLPDARSMVGRSIRVICLSGANAVTVNQSNSQDINGAGDPFAVSGAYVGADFLSLGNSWYASFLFPSN